MEHGDSAVVFPGFVMGRFFRTQNRSTRVLALHDPETTSFFQAHDLDTAVVEERVEVENVHDAFRVDHWLSSVVLCAEGLLSSLEKT